MRPDNPLYRVLTIDLSRRGFSIEARPELFTESLGGTGAAVRLLEEHCPEGTDPLGPRNPIIFTVGPLVGFYPLASKTVAMFKSPHTGNLGESHAGGRSAVSIRMAGYGGIVIHGTSKSPVYLVIEDGMVHFRDASALWGMTSSYTIGSVLRKQEHSSGLRTIMRIGRAGEKQVSYSCVITETYRHFGRLGLGAVFGSKLLKGIVISGRRSLEPADKRLFRKTYQSIYKSAAESELMEKYHQLGTAVNIAPLNTLGGLPTRNLQEGRFEGASRISGEAMAEDFLGRRVACAHCPVACVHLAALRSPYPNDPYFYKTSMIGYDYEPIYSMGSMLGIDRPEDVLCLIDEAELQGLDVMSAGVALAWATEAQHEGLIPEGESDGVTLNFGDRVSYLAAMERIVTQPTDFYRALARGVEHASSVYGGADYALAFGGNEMPGYHTGPGSHLGYLTGSRHSHLDSAGYSLDQQAVREDRSLDPAAVARELLEEERWRQVLTSLVICLFARNIYTEETILPALESLGMDWTPGKLKALGREILHRKQAFKEREGFAFADMRIPKRILKTVSPLGPIDELFLREALREFSARVHEKD